jgi:DNA-binding GntR family transcriptional regulator
MIEEDLSRQLGISRGPIREALRQLEHEGLIVTFPYRGAEVVGVSEAELREVLLPIRVTVERFAFRHALAKLSETDIVDLRRLVDTMREEGAAGNLVAAVEADLRFHELVLERSQQPHCVQIWRTILPRVRAYFYRCGPMHPTPTDIAEEHQELLETLLTHDIEQVLTLLDKHILELPQG